MDVLEIAVKDRKIVRVGQRDYALSYPLAAVAALEVKLGHSMKSAADWLRMETREVRDILAAGLRTYHPEDADAVADEICSALDPEEIENVIEALCVAACPKAMARVKQAMEEAQARLKKGIALPNAEGAGVS